MKNKVSIREVVASKIVIAMLIAGYYWMWVEVTGSLNIEKFQVLGGFFYFNISSTLLQGIQI